MGERLLTASIDEVEVTATKTAIFNLDGEMLVLRRNDRGPRPDRPDHRGELDLPGGEVKVGRESIRSGVIREIWEETRLLLTRDKLHHCFTETTVVTRDFGPLCLNLFGFVALIPPDQEVYLDLEEHDAAYWLKPRDFLDGTNSSRHHRLIACMSETDITSRLLGIDIDWAA